MAGKFPAIPRLEDTLHKRILPDFNATTICSEAAEHCEGMIGRAGRGEHGFGYDPLFVPDDQPGRTNADGEPLTSAEMTPEEKNAISHRGKALRALMPELAAALL